MKELEIKKGDVFGKLTVVRKAKKEETFGKNAGSYYWCKCSCGNPELVLVSATNLRKQRVKSCGCLHKNSKHFIKRVPGAIVNKWELLSFFIKNNKKYWKVKCSCCGEETIILNSCLHKHFCKKRQKEGRILLKNVKEHPVINETPTNVKELTGTFFGKMEVLGYCCKILDYHYWVCKCHNCNQIKIMSSTTLRSKKTFACGCVNSLGELKITQFLIKNDIKFISQYKFQDCVNIKELKFDFLVYYPNTNDFFMLEFQGKQHEEPTSFSSDKSKEAMEANLKYNQLRDNIKRKYCKNNNIELLEISCKDYDNIEEILAKKLGIKLENT